MYHSFEGQGEEVVLAAKLPGNSRWRKSTKKQLTRFRLRIGFGLHLLIHYGHIVNEAQPSWFITHRQ